MAQTLLDAGRRSVPVTAVRAVIGVQLYVVAAYLAAAIVPYLWRGHPAPPTWSWIVPGWLLGVPGFWIALLGPWIAVPLALTGAAVLLRHHRAMSTRLRAWCLGTTALACALAAFSLTPLARAIAAWVAD